MVYISANTTLIFSSYEIINEKKNYVFIKNQIQFIVVVIMSVIVIHSNLYFCKCGF